jgi:hypothetical protein
VISACLMSSASSSLSLPLSLSLAILLALVPLLPGIPSDYVGAERVDIRSIRSSDSPCDFRLLSLFLLRICYLSVLFLFYLGSLLLRLCRFLFFSFSFSLSYSSASFTIYYADRNYSSSSLSPLRLQWYQLLVVPLLKIPLTTS